MKVGIGDVIMANERTKWISSFLLTAIVYWGLGKIGLFLAIKNISHRTPNAVADFIFAVFLYEKIFKNALSDLGRELGLSIKDIGVGDGEPVQVFKIGPDIGGWADGFHWQRTIISFHRE